MNSAATTMDEFDNALRQLCALENAARRARRTGDIEAAEAAEAAAADFDLPERPAGPMTLFLGPTS